MPTAENLSSLIGDLSADLKPVRPLWRPAIRAAVWVALVAALAVYLYASGGQLRLGVAETPDAFVVLGVLASALTAALAAIAAFELSLPDRSRSWAFLPLPALGLWIAVTGVGCLANLGNAGPGMFGATLDEAWQCLSYIAKWSLPVSLVLILMLRRARPLRPVLVATMAGMAAAGAGASLLIMVHVHESTAIDLLLHFGAVGLVVALNAALGGKLLGAGGFSRPVPRSAEPEAQ